MKKKFVFNPLTANFDLITIPDDEANQILVHEYNQAGNPLMLVDQVTGQALSLGPLPVFDNEGNMVKA